MQVTKIFPIGFVHHTADRFHNGVAQGSALRGAELLRQPCDHFCLVFLVHFPKPGILTAPNRVGIGNVMDVLNVGFSASPFAYQTDSGGTGIDPAVHFVVPDFNLCTGCCIRALGVNQKLVIKIIAFIEPGSGSQKSPPVLGRVGNFFLSLLRQFRDVGKPSACHCVLLSKMKTPRTDGLSALGAYEITYLLSCFSWFAAYRINSSGVGILPFLGTRF